MEKLSLFDVILSVVPGGASLVFVYWAVVNTTGTRLDGLPLPDLLTALVLGALAYFVGHFVNDWGIRLEKWLGGAPKSWIEILEANTYLAQQLNAAAQHVFGLSFVTAEGKIDPNTSDQFYDNAFNVLEINGKIEKVRALQSQYTFFRSAVVVGVLASLCFAAVTVAQLRRGIPLHHPGLWACLAGLALCLLSIGASRRLSFKRRKMKMNATLNGFLAYYASDLKFKKLN